MKILYINSNYSYSETLKEMEKLKTSIDEEKNYLFNHFLIMIHFKNGMYNKALEIAKENISYIPSLAIYGYVVKLIGTEEEKKKFLESLKITYFNKYQGFYSDFCNYLNYSIKGESAFHLFNYLKQVVLNENNLFYDFFLRKMSVRELLETGILSSKYKESLRYVIEKKLI